MPLFKVLASPFLSLQQALTVCDDCWTWTTLNGDIYEDVELISLTSDEATIRHADGVSTIARANLTREIQQSLIDNSEMTEPDFAADDDVEADDHFRVTGKSTLSRSASYSEAA